ncbi:hypothetical protein LSAT2_015900 [Lamellibrachia satsuma]|nr:hypothetical protein LSAT2_015900 [Lamellibrachia satsuma]
MKDAGTYRCKYIPLPSVYKEAKLVILESRPNCTMNLTKEAAAEGDYVRMTCEVTYSGKWAPTPTLRWDNRRYDRRLYRTTSNIVVRAENATEGNRLTATQVIELTPTNNRGYFRCRVFFETLGISTSCETERFYVYYHFAAKSSELAVECVYRRSSVYHGESGRVSRNPT